MAYFKQEKPKRNPAANAPVIKNSGEEFMESVGRGEVPREKRADPEIDTSKIPKPKGMGLGKSLVNKTFKDGEDQYKITVTKVGKEK
jgi:hypothetical protein